MNRDECKTTAQISLYDDSDRGQEIVIDTHMAQDLIRLTLNQQMDMVLVFSHDQDFAEVASELRVISIKTDYVAEITSTFPKSELANNKRCANGFDCFDWLMCDILD